MTLTGFSSADGSLKRAHFQKTLSEAVCVVVAPQNSIVSVCTLLVFPYIELQDFSPQHIEVSIYTSKKIPRVGVGLASSFRD